MAEANSSSPVSDLWWFIGMLGLLAVFWWVSGGPNQPESQSGPLIAPPPPLGTGEISGLNSAGGVSGDGGNITSGVSSAPKVRLERGNAQWETFSNREYLTIEADWNNQAPVVISGWQIKGARMGKTVSIPLASKLFVLGAANLQRDPVMLAPGERAVVVSGGPPNTGTFPRPVSFKVNRCSGYLADESSIPFSPDLPRSCPAPEGEPGAAALPDDCYNFVRRLYSCHQPKFETKPDGYSYIDGQRDRLSSQCRDFVKTHFHYNGCLTWHSQDADFWGKEWRVYLNSAAELWAENRETITLLDAGGVVAEEISY